MTRSKRRNHSSAATALAALKGEQLAVRPELPRACPNDR